MLFNIMQLIYCPPYSEDGAVTMYYGLTVESQLDTEYDEHGDPK
jgi:hypothetical protein